MERLYRDVLRHQAGQKLRPRAPRDRPLQAGGRPHDGCAHCPDVATVAVFARRRPSRSSARQSCSWSGPPRDAPADDHRRPHHRHRLPGAAVRTAVSHRTHDGTAAGSSGRCEARPRHAGARPETTDTTPEAVDAASVKGDIRFENVGFNARRHRRPARHHIRREPRRNGRARRTDRRRQDDARQPDSPVLRRPPGVCSSTGSMSGNTMSLAPRHIAIVLQDPVLFAGTIADNLRYGRLDAARRDRGGGARRACARLHFAPAEGLRHRHRRGRSEPVGRRTSAAERARAILKNAPILILDEPPRRSTPSPRKSCSPRSSGSASAERPS